MESKQAVIVTTKHQGVFFGYGEVTVSDVIRLERCRMCIYWPESAHGIVGLASDGPNKGAKVGPAAPAITIRDVTSIIEVTDKARNAWEAEPWA